MLRDCSDVSSRWDQQRLQSAQCNLPCWLRLPQRMSPKKPQNPLTGLESRPSVMSPYRFLSRVRGHAHSQVLAPPLLRPFSFSVPRDFFLGGGAVLLFTSKPSPSSSFFQRHHLFVPLGIPVHYSEVPQLPHDSAFFF